ncbi:DUF5085 family protein [Ureibacillus composti]|nr:DUF5085 family protein [Ureibacillus composti]
MIVEKHQITYRNVASKYYNFVPEEIHLAFEDFDRVLSKYGFNVANTMFFSIISDPTASVMTAEIFRPIEESDFSAMPTSEGVNFRSYFSVDGMLMTRIMDQFDELSQVKYWELVKHIQENDFTQSSPIFVEYKRSHSGVVYVEMSVGVR